MKDSNKTSKIKVKIGRGEKKSALKMDKQGPRMNDINKKTSRWKKLPVKNVIKISSGVEMGKSRRRFVGVGVLIIIFAVLLAGALGVFGYLQFFGTKATEVKLLPDITAFVAKVDTKHLFPDEGKENKIDSRYDFMLDKFTNVINEEVFNLGINFSDNIKPLIGDSISAAYLKDEEMSGFLFIADIVDLDLLDQEIEDIAFKATLLRSDYQGVEIIKIEDKKSDNVIFLTILDSNLVVTKKEELLSKVVDTYQGHTLPLYETKDYKSVRPLLPGFRFASIYVKTDGLEGLLPEDGNTRVYWKAVTHKMSHAFASINIKDEGLDVGIKAQNVDETSRSGISKKLLEMLPSDTSGFVSGKSLQADYGDLKNDLAESDPALEFYFENLIGKVEDRTNSEFDNGLLSNFDSEYVMSFDYAGDHLNYNFIIKLNDVEAAQNKLVEIEDAVSSYYGSKNPKKQEMELSDGSIVNELLPDKEAFQFSDVDFEGLVVRSIVNAELERNFSYVIKDDVLLASTSLGSLKNILAASDGVDKLFNKRYFNVPYQNTSKLSSEGIVYLDAGDLYEQFDAKGYWGKFLQAFDNTVISTSSGNGKLYIKGFLFAE